MTGRRTEVSQFVNAPRRTVFRAFMEPEWLVVWLAPDTMRGQVHTFEPRQGGRFRMSLTYQQAEDAGLGKSSDNTDTFEGLFAEIIPNETIVWRIVFESDQPEFAGEMRMTWTLADVPGGTEVTCLCEDIPAGIRLEDNEVGTRQSLRKLAALVESGALPA